MWKCNCGKLNEDKAQVCISCGELKAGVSSSTLNNKELINITLDTRRRILEKAIKEDLVHNNDIDKCIQSCNEILSFDLKNSLATIVKKVLSNVKEINELIKNEDFDKALHDQALLTVHDLENSLEEYHRHFGNKIIPNAFDSGEYCNPPVINNNNLHKNVITCKDVIRIVDSRYKKHVLNHDQNNQRIRELMNKIKSNNNAILKKRDFYAVEDYFDFQKTVVHQIDHLEKLNQLNITHRKLLPDYIITDKKMMRQRLYIYLNQVRVFFYNHLKNFEDEFLTMQDSLTLEGFKDEFLTVKINRHIENFRKIDDLKNEDPKLKTPPVILKYPTEREFSNFLVKVENRLQAIFSKQQKNEFQYKIEEEKKIKDSEIARTKFISVIRELETKIEHQIKLSKSELYSYSNIIKDVKEHTSKLNVYQQLYKGLPRPNEVTYLSSTQLMTKVAFSHKQNKEWKLQLKKNTKAEKDEQKRSYFLKVIVDNDRKLDLLLKTGKHTSINVENLKKLHDIQQSKLKSFFELFGTYPKTSEVYYNTPDILTSNFKQALKANQEWKTSKQRESTLTSLKERDNKIDILLKTARQISFQPSGIQKLVAIQIEKLDYFRGKYKNYPEASELICNTPKQLQTKLDFTIKTHNDWLQSQKESQQRNRDRVKKAYLEKELVEKLAKLREAEIFIELSFKKSKEPNWKSEIASEKIEKQIPYLDDYKRKFGSYPVKELKYGTPKLLKAALKVAITEHNSIRKDLDKPKYVKPKYEKPKQNKLSEETLRLNMITLIEFDKKIGDMIRNIFSKPYYKTHYEDVVYAINQTEQFLSYYKKVDEETMKLVRHKLNYADTGEIFRDIQRLRYQLERYRY